MTSENGAAEKGGESRRKTQRLSTVYGGKLSQLGRVYPCVVSDVSETGAKIRFKDPEHMKKVIEEEAVQLIFDRLGEYKGLRAAVAWFNRDNATIGLLFSDSERVRHMVLSKLMPGRWQLINAKEAGG